MSKQRDFIERLRKEEFGIGADLDGDARTIVDNLTRKYRNLLATVAEDLNSKESHFILELIQNADDNHYREGVAPSLSFRMEPNRLVVVNNESGFDEVNVKALCSAGESSKKNKKGYIGEKGIGFKSIFKVTDTPEVHSNGFHFAFNRTDPKDLLGYVVPHWHEPDFKVDERATTLVLPAKPGSGFTKRTLADVSDTLLLFLGKLRQLEVVSPDRREHFKRHDHGALTTLTTTMSGEKPVRQDYLRKKVDFDVSDIHESKREGIASTEMVLAFALSDDGAAAPAPGCPTYAFLPIRDFGFSFYIQADFVLISSREGIHEDLPWNIRLRDGIAGAFAAAVHEFKQRPALASTYLRYLPSADQVHDPFFAHVVTNIIDELKKTECVPAMGGGWRRPGDVLIASDKIRELFPSKDALALFGADYPADDFYLPPKVVASLGLRQLLVADVVALFTEHAEWFLGKSAEWKAKFFAHLATSPKKGEYVKQLQKVACVPVEGGKLAVPQSGEIFFPLNAGKKYGFEGELNILDGTLLQLASEISGAVPSFFAELNVRRDEPYELIRSHILKFHADERWTEAKDVVLIGHVRYIKDKLAQYLRSAVAAGQSESQAIQVLRDGLMIGTKQQSETWIFARAKELYLGTEYVPELDIEGLLGEGAPLARLITSKYLERQRKGEDADKRSEALASWREFFVRIGANVSPLAERRPNGDVVFSAELDQLLRSGSASTRRKTLESIDRCWHNYTSGLTYQSGRYTYATTFVTQLRDVAAPTKGKAKTPLAASYLENDGTRAILGDTVAYVDAALSNIGFLDASGITYKVDASACLKRLRQIKSGGAAGIDQLRKIYRHLESFWGRESALIDSAFSKEGLIRIGRGGSMKWVLPNEACWNQTNIEFLDSRHPSLSGPYKDHFTFFTRMLKVPQELGLENWVDALGELEELDRAQRGEVAIAIYRRLAKAVERHNRDDGSVFAIDWISEFDHYALLLDKRGDMVDKSEHIYADDRPEYSGLFSDIDEVSFLAVSPDRLPGIAPLLNELQVRSVSDVMTIEVADDLDGRVDEALSQKLREMLVPIARIAYSQGHDRFEDAIDHGLFSQLSEASIVEVGELVQLVSLGEWHRETTGQSARRGSQIFLDERAPSKIDYVAIEVEKMLGLRKGTSDAISRLLMSTPGDAAAYLKVRQTPELPMEELEKVLGFVDDNVVPDPTDDDNYDEPTSFDGGIHAASDSLDTEGNTSTHRPRIGDRADSSHAGLQPGAGAPAEDGTARPPRPQSDYVVTSDRARVAPRPPEPAAASPGTQHGNGSARKDRTKTGRLLSYAEPKGPKEVGGADAPTESSEMTAHKRAVEQAAVTFFRETVACRWKRVEEMPPNNEGFDFKAVSMDGNEEIVEIKGQGGAWTEEGVALTPLELLAASAWKDRHWLCVVEFALDQSRRRLWLIQNPFGKANQFRFDLGWKDVAEESEGGLHRPEVGLFVDVPEKGRGTIRVVEGNAILTRITIEFPDKSRLTRTFNPATMKLSEG
ncbi:sacsin N-terminal ATP-binding-like domain-containing protein [Pseudoxanthomonas sp.]|uniref:sacsin N-terminal ATP-binding-like domain-containing protein n=1 Tax=Pseudoxanthomonas sp. TaxID=1871049 RepID=UPI0035B4A420